MKDKFILVVIALTVLLVGGGVFLATKMSGSQIEVSPDAKVSVESTSYDWGDIKIGDGKVTASFAVKNEGGNTLKLYNVTTSCACTSAQLIFKDVKSPLFGMHTKSNYVMDVPPGEVASLEVIFDPEFHGPNAVGAITRQIKVETNDPNNKTLNFDLSANVTK